MYFFVPLGPVKKHVDTFLSDFSFLPGHKADALSHSWEEYFPVRDDAGCGETCRSARHPQYRRLSSAPWHLVSIIGNPNASVSLWPRSHGSGGIKRPLTSATWWKWLHCRLYLFNLKLFIFIFKFQCNLNIYFFLFTVLHLQLVTNLSKSEFLKLWSVKYSTTYFIFRP